MFAIQVFRDQVLARGRSIDDWVVKLNPSARLQAWLSAIASQQQLVECFNIWYIDRIILWYRLPRMLLVRRNELDYQLNVGGGSEDGHDNGGHKYVTQPRLLQNRHGRACSIFTQHDLP